MTKGNSHIGVDVAKHWIDVFDLRTGHQRIVSEPGALRALAEAADGAIIVFEASGGYERPLMEALDRAGCAHHRVNPYYARAFAQATGRLAKTDRVDARMLAQMGQALQLQAQDISDPACQHLSDIISRLEGLKGHRQAERNRLEQAQIQSIRTEITQMIAILDDRISRYEAQIKEVIAKKQVLQDRYGRLQTVPGIGPTIAAHLVASLPELGRLDRRSLASLAGLAPIARDSGIWRGKRSIGAGRGRVKRALYQAAFIASRWDTRLKSYRNKLQTAGKPAKVAIIATARKLLTIINQMIKNQQNYNPNTP